MDLNGIAEKYNLSKDTTDCLINEAFVTATALRGLTSEVVDTFKLKLGEKAALKVVIADLNAPPTTSSTAATNEGPPVAEGQRNDAATPLDQLLGELTLGEPRQLRGAQDPQAWLQIQRPDSKTTLLIPDFLPSTECLEEVALGTGSSVVFKTGAKTKLKDVSPAQWITANARIMAKLLQSKSLSGSAVLDYLSYTAKVGELACRFTWASTLQYDNEYRLQQAAVGFRWGADSQHLATTLLREKPIEKTTTKGQGQRGGAGNNTSKKKGPGGREICLQYNAGKCTFGPKCNFEHVCLKCLKPGHTQATHRDSAQEEKEAE